jgi:hypothetical protein
MIQKTKINPSNISSVVNIHGLNNFIEVRAYGPYTKPFYMDVNDIDLEKINLCDKKGEMVSNCGKIVYITDKYVDYQEYYDCKNKNETYVDPICCPGCDSCPLHNNNDNNNKNSTNDKNLIKFTIEGIDVFEMNKSFPTRICNKLEVILISDIRINISNNTAAGINNTSQYMCVENIGCFKISEKEDIIIYGERNI